MHLYIYQVFKEPHPKTDWATNAVFTANPSLMPFADYISKVPDRRKAIQDLGDWLDENCLGTLSGDAFSIRPGSAQSYLRDRYGAFRKALGSLQKVTEAQFTDSFLYVESLISDLHSGFSNPYGDYVMAEDSPPVPFDQFIRTAEPGIPFYIGGIMDCHY